MGRLWRVEYVGACYHVINRGNYRQDIFRDDGAASAFEKALGQAAVRFRWKVQVHAYVIMRNHFHIALELTEATLSVGMQWLRSTWARRYNNYRNVTGRPFQGRYKALHVEPDQSLARVCDYIHLNPARAHVVGVEGSGGDRFSSFYSYARASYPAWLHPDNLLHEAGELPNNRVGWREYRQHLGRINASDVDRSAAAAEFSRGWCIGSLGFRRAVKAKAVEKGYQQEVCVFPGLRREEVFCERAEIWQEQLTSLAAKAGVSLERLPSQKWAPEKLMLAAAMKTSSSATNAWLARKLRTGSPKGLSVGLARWREARANTEAGIPLLNVEA